MSATAPASSVHWSLHVITYPLLLVYFLPVLVIYWVSIRTDTFLNDADGILGFARAIAGPFFDTVRSTMGAIFVPFVMAYAVKDRQPDQPIPRSTLGIFLVFLVFFVATTVLYGLVEMREVSLRRHLVTVGGKGVAVYEVYRDTALAYARESLTYIALVLGIALRPAASAALTGRPKA
ncbi:MAG: hypothetical protein AB7I35_01770 [Ramlibacter sp.]